MEKNLLKMNFPLKYFKGSPLPQDKTLILTLKHKALTPLLPFPHKYS